MGLEIQLHTIEPGDIHRAVENADPIFDAFHYFNDFAMEILGWKMGSHADIRQGFLDLAPGRLSPSGDIARPVTADPWILNQIIREITSFFPVRPHALHLSFQLRRNQIGRKRVLQLNIAQCLLALGGGFALDRDGQAPRFAQTRNYQTHLFATEDLNKPVFVHQYRLTRLEKQADYEPLIMALKGIQVAMNPADTLTAEHLAANSELRDEYEAQKDWTTHPTPIDSTTKKDFLDTVRDGLMHEAHRKPYHQPPYIDRILMAIDSQIRLFNQRIEKGKL